MRYFLISLWVVVLAFSGCAGKTRDQVTKSIKDIINIAPAVIDDVSSAIDKASGVFTEKEKEGESAPAPTPEPVKE